MSSAVPVAVTGFTWSAGLLALLNVFIGGLLVAIVRTWPSIRKLANEREANLLEERAHEMEGMRKRLAKLEVQIERKDKIHDAERAYDRHRINNLDTALKAFFILVRRHPDDAAGAASEVEAMRATQIEGEKRESLALRDLVARLTTSQAGEEE